MINRIACRCFNALMICLLTVLLGISLISTTHIDENEGVYYVSDFPLVHFGIILLLVISAALLKTKFNIRLQKRCVLILAGIVGMIMLIYVSLTMYYPRFDQRHVLQIAGYMLDGNYEEFLPGGYAQIYPYQNGLILFYEFMTILFKDMAYVAIQYVNLVFIMLSYGALYVLYKKYVGSHLYALAGILLFIPMWGYVTFVYGNVPALCFGLWGAVFFLEVLSDERKFASEWGVLTPKALLAGMLLALASIFKVTQFILIIALFIAAALELLKNKNIKSIVLILATVVMIIAGNSAVNHAVVNQTRQEVSEGIPALPYIAMGLHEQVFRGAGWHDNYPENLYEETGYDAKLTNEAAINDIKENIDNFLAHPSYFVGFYVRKTAAMWNEPSYDSLSMQMNRTSQHEEVLPAIRMMNERGALNSFIYQLMNILESIILFGALVYFIMNFKNDDMKSMTLALFVMGGYCFHMIWESSSQYAVFYMLILSAYALIGYRGFVLYLLKAGKKRIVRLLAAALVIILVLSIPKVCSVLTLDRSNELYGEYLSGTLDWQM